MHTILLSFTFTAANHLLASPDGSQYGLLQSGLHVLRFFKCQAINPFQSLFPLWTRNTPAIMGQRQGKESQKKQG